MYMGMSPRIEKQFNGFGLIETVIAVGILTMVTGASLALTNAVIRNNIVSQQRTIASFTTQEGIERVRNIYSTNLIDENPATTWGDRLIGGASPLGSNYKLSCYMGGRWFLLNVVLITCPTPADTITIDNVIYCRLFNIVDASANEKVVTTKVSWPDCAGPNVISREIRLYDPGI